MAGPDSVFMWAEPHAIADPMEARDQAKGQSRGTAMQRDHRRIRAPALPNIALRSSTPQAVTGG